LRQHCKYVASLEPFEQGIMVCPSFHTSSCSFWPSILFLAQAEHVTFQLEVSFNQLQVINMFATICTTICNTYDVGWQSTNNRTITLGN
jgi:hypothetical protein